MAYKIGNDVTKISRFNKLVDNEAFYKRVLSPKELIEYKKVPHISKSLYLAKRWALKEAILKMKALGMENKHLLTTYTLINKKNEKPFIENENIDISISHEEDYLFVTCVEEKKMLVSLIVPVYNIEDNIKNCLESILEQKYKNIEIIVVNDGSCDNSLEIINSLNDQRIKVYTTKNQGLGAARNFGYLKSKGEYICYIDGDDSIEPHYVENMLKWAQKDYDIVVCDYNLVFTNKNGLNPFKKIANKIVSPKRFKGIDDRLVLNYRYIAWNKMYKRELLEDFSWGEGAHEDICALALLFKNPNIKYIQDKLYNYYKRSNTLSTSVSEDKISNIKQNYDYVINNATDHLNALYLRQYSSLLVNIVALYQSNELLLSQRLDELNREFYMHTQDVKLRSKLGIAKKKYVEAGLKKDVKRLLFINKFVSK